MNNKEIVSWDEIFEGLPEDQKVTILESDRKDRQMFQSMAIFRQLKEIVREHLNKHEQLDPESIRKIEKHADLLLAIFRTVAEREGGNFKVLIEMPNHKSYNLFELRDLYHDFEGTPLGPFYEEEDINEANRLEELREDESSPNVYGNDGKLAA